MSKVFLSHSSKDKEFVTKLSHYLLKNNIPIWLDTYELSIGDSLYDKIFSGLNDSNFMIVVVSKNYNQTLWTSKEFKAILAKEDRDHKKYLIPIKIDDTLVPLEIEDRIYQNFQVDFDESIKKLVRFFKKEDLSIENVAISSRQIILSFKSFIDIDIEILKSILIDINLYQSYKFLKTQIFFTEYNKIDTLLSIGKKNISSVVNNEELLNQFDQNSLQIEKYLDFLLKGTIKILNGYIDNRNNDFISTCIYWFTRGIMCEISSLILRYLDREQAVQFNLDFDNDMSLPFSQNFRRFYKTDSHCQLDVFDKTNSSIYFSPHLDGEFSAYKELKKYPIHMNFWEAFDTNSLSKYFVPQNVFYHVADEKLTPLLTDFNKYSVGLH